MKQIVKENGGQTETKSGIGRLVDSGIGRQIESGNCYISGFSGQISVIAKSIHPLEIHPRRYLYKKKCRARRVLRRFCQSSEIAQREASAFAFLAPEKSLKKRS